MNGSPRRWLASSMRALTWAIHDSLGAEAVPEAGVREGAGGAFAGVGSAPGAVAPGSVAHEANRTIAREGTRRLKWRRIVYPGVRGEGSTNGAAGCPKVRVHLASIRLPLPAPWRSHVATRKPTTRLKSAAAETTNPASSDAVAAGGAPEWLLVEMTGRASPAKAKLGDEPVFAYFRSLPQPQRGIAERVDALAAKTLPGVQRCVKWGMAFYGVGDGWCFSCGGFVGHVKLTFGRGTSLNPTPPVTPTGMGKDSRGVDLQSVDDIDEARLGAWMTQATAIPGFGGKR